MERLLRGLSLVAGFFMMSVAGTLYLFSVYGPTLKSVMGFSQLQIGLIGAMGNVGNYLGVIVGTFFDRFGGQATSVLAGSFLFCGYFGIYLMLTEVIPSSLFLLSVCMFFVGQGSHGTYTASLMTNVKNFLPEHRGKLVGALVSLYGLSGAIFSQIYKIFFAESGDISSFLLTMAIALFAVDICSAAILRVVPPTTESKGTKWVELEDMMFHQKEKKGLGDAANGEKELELGEKEELIVDKEKGGDNEEDAGEGEEEEEGRDEEGRLNAREKDGNELEEIILDEIEVRPLTTQQDPSLSVDTSPATHSEEGMFVLKTKAFWFLFVSFFVSAGTGLMFINHVGSQVLSVGGTASDQVVVVIIISVANAAGRLAIGLLSDYLQAKVPRVVFLLGCIFLMGSANLALSLAYKLWIIAICAPAVAFAYGGLFAVYPLLVSFLFGLKNFGQNWGWMVVAPAMGSLFFGFVFSLVYDIHSDKEDDGTPTDDHKCFGTKCFALAYLLTGFLNLTVVLISFILLRKNEYLRKRFQVSGLSSEAPVRFNKEEAVDRIISEPMGTNSIVLPSEAGEEESDLEGKKIN